MASECDSQGREKSRSIGGHSAELDGNMAKRPALKYMSSKETRRLLKTKGGCLYFLKEYSLYLLKLAFEVMGFHPHIYPLFSFVHALERGNFKVTFL